VIDRNLYRHHGHRTNKAVVPGDVIDIQPIDDRAWSGPGANGERRSWNRQPVGGDTLLADECSEHVRIMKMRDIPVTE
jgi:hypothetical protein